MERHEFGSGARSGCCQLPRSKPCSTGTGRGREESGFRSLLFLIFSFAQPIPEGFQSLYVVADDLDCADDRHCQDQPVKFTQLLERDEGQGVLMLDPRRISKGIGDQRIDAEFAQLRHDIRHPAVAQIGDVLLERDAEDADLRALDRPVGCDQQLDEAPVFLLKC